MLKLSIITINYNNCAGLTATVKSVLNQTFKNFEYLIIDGGSTDGSAAFIQENVTQFTYAVSEADGGIYAAMNKGILKAKGEYLLFLNSGDTLTSRTILEEVLVNITTPQADIYYTDVYFIDEVAKTRWLKKYPTTLTTDYWVQSSLCHQTMLMRKTMSNCLGLFDEHYRMSADWIYGFQAFLKGCTFQKISDVILSNYILDGYSANYVESKKQHLHFITKHIPEELSTYKKHFDQKNLWERTLLKLKAIFKNNNDSLKKQRALYQEYVKQSQK